MNSTAVSTTRRTKVLCSIILVGSSYPNSSCGLRGWRYSPGFAQLRYTDGTTRYCGDVSFNAALEMSKKGLDDTAVFEQVLADQKAGIPDAWEKKFGSTRALFQK